MQAKTANSLYSLRFPPWTSRKSLKYKFFNMHMNSALGVFFSRFWCVHSLSLSFFHTETHQPEEIYVKEGTFRISWWNIWLYAPLDFHPQFYMRYLLTAFTLTLVFFFTFTANRIVYLFSLLSIFFREYFYAVSVKNWIWCGIK